MPFPSGITPILRFDATQTAYQDLAQAAPAVALGDRVRSIPQPSPLSGSWTAPSDAERPSRDGANSIVCEPLALDYPTHVGQFFNAPSSTAVTCNNATIAVSFRALCTYGAPANALLSYGQIWGLELVGNGVAVRHSSGAQWYAGAALGKDLGGAAIDGPDGAGNLVCIVARYTPTGIDLYIDEEGTVTSFSLVASIPSGTVPLLTLGGTGSGYGNAAFGQAMVANSAISDSDRTALITYMKSVAPAPAFPLDRPFVDVIADSIGQGSGASRPESWCYRMLANLRTSYPTLRLHNSAIVGSGVVPLTGNNSTQYKTAVALVSSSRTSNVVIVALGSNEIANNPDNASVDAKLASLFALTDALRTLGAKVACADILPRSTFGGGTTQSQFNSARIRWRAALDANAGTRFDRLIDLRAVTGMGAAGDSDNTTNYGDGVHPTAVGYALLEPAYTAAVVAMLSGLPVVTGKILTIERTIDWASDPRINLLSLVNS